MALIERMTVTLPADMASVVRGAVEGGDYASSSEVVREALREWKNRREEGARSFAALKADIDRGLNDIRRGRTVPFQPKRIALRGRQRLSSSAASD